MATCLPLFLVLKYLSSIWQYLKLNKKIQEISESWKFEIEIKVCIYIQAKGGL